MNVHVYVDVSLWRHVGGGGVVLGGGGGGGGGCYE